MIDLVTANEFTFSPSAFLAAYIEQEDRTVVTDTTTNSGSLDTAPKTMSNLDGDIESFVVPLSYKYAAGNMTIAASFGNITLSGPVDVNSYDVYTNPTAATIAPLVSQFYDRAGDQDTIPAPLATSEPDPTTNTSVSTLISNAAQNIRFQRDAINSVSYTTNPNKVTFPNQPAINSRLKLYYYNKEAAGNPANETLNGAGAADFARQGVMFDRRTGILSQNDYTTPAATVSGSLVDVVGQVVTDTRAVTKTTTTAKGVANTVVLVLSYGTFKAKCSNAQATVTAIYTQVAAYLNSL